MRPTTLTSSRRQPTVIPPNSFTIYDPTARFTRATRLCGATRGTDVTIGVRFGNGITYLIFTEIVKECYASSEVRLRSNSST